MKTLKKVFMLPLLLGFILTACGTNEQSAEKPVSKQKNTEEATKDTSSEKQSETSEETVNQEKEEDKPNDQQNAENTASANSVKVYKSEGTFVGLADNHTIAVDINGKEIAIQVDNTLKNKISKTERRRLSKSNIRKRSKRYT
ncbi:hypothetical protein [Bacillus atrophaeus]|uniref:hypothetical protein n=1 Tax=Bacillus atrophaeus TaxID=1452 RepID=UPI0002FA6326|nr:hypothetical protein [Bacillus atrophaeus]